MSAYGTSKQKDSFRKTWDKEEYAEKARQKDEEARQQAQEAEKALQQGKQPPRRRKDNLPKPTENLKARDKPLELDKNLNKTILASSAQGSRGPGFYCETCNRTYKDSVGYLDHLNGRGHLRRLGQTTRVTRSTLDQVRAKIAALREQTAQSSSEKRYDFSKRLKEIRDEEAAARKDRRDKKKEAKLREEREKNESMDADIVQAMGFGGFEGSRK